MLILDSMLLKLKEQTRMNNWSELWSRLQIQYFDDLTQFGAIGQFDPGLSLCMSAAAANIFFAHLNN